MPTWPKRNPQANPYKCSANWHLRKNGLWLATYNLVGTITNGGKTEFFGSYQGVADYFGSSYESQRRVFHALAKYGWLEELPEAGRYNYVSHEKRTFLKDDCYKRELLTWQKDVDPLIGKMWAVCGGKFKIMEWKIAWARKHGTDAEILALFTAEVEKAKADRAKGSYQGTSNAACFFRVVEHLKHK